MGSMQHRATAPVDDLERYRRTRSVLPILAASLTDEDLHIQERAVGGIVAAGDPLAE